MELKMTKERRSASAVFSLHGFEVIEQEALTHLRIASPNQDEKAVAVQFFYGETLEDYVVWGVDNEQSAALQVLLYNEGKVPKSWAARLLSPELAASLKSQLMETRVSMEEPCTSQY